MRDFRKILFVLFFIGVLYIPHDSHAQVIQNLLQVNPDLVSNPKEAAVFTENCNMYPGFLNRIVQCINHMTTRSTMAGKINVMHHQFASLTNVAMVLYLMFFGMKLSMNVVQNVRGEIMVVLITCFLITYVNNAIRMQTFMQFFIDFQNEFVNVATLSIYSAEKDDPNFQIFACNDSNLALGDGSNTYRNIWSRADCLIAYIVGAHPVIERAGQMYDQKGTDLPGAAAEIQSMLAGAGLDASLDKKYLWKFPKPNQPFDNMALSPYSFGRTAYIERLLAIMSPTDIINFIKAPKAETLTAASPDISLTEANQIVKNVQIGDANLDLLTHPRPVNNSITKSSLTFSLLIIMVGMLLNDPTVGLMVFISGAFIILLVIVAFGQAILVYFTSLFAILVLGLFAPLILPTILFQQTRRIFEEWLHLLFAYSMQSGIMLCYLSFMVYVLQYVVSYKSCLTTDLTKTADPSKDCHGLADYHFGDMFIKGDMSPKPALTMTKQNTNEKGSIATDIQGSVNSQNVNPLNPSSQLYSFMNKGSTAFDPMVNQIAQEDNDVLAEKGFQLKNRGAANSSISFPGFSFFGGDILGKPDIGSAIGKLFQNYGSYNSNISNSAKDAQNMVNTPNMSVLTDPNGCVGAGTIDFLSTFKCLIKVDQIQQYNMKVAYMQTLLIILITLCITFVFLGNVMDFSGKLVMGSAAPVGRAVNIYGLATKKLGGMLKGDVK